MCFFGRVQSYKHFCVTLRCASVQSCKRFSDVCLPSSGPIHGAAYSRSEFVLLNGVQTVSSTEDTVIRLQLTDGAHTTNTQVLCGGVCEKVCVYRTWKQNIFTKYVCGIL